MSVYGHLWGTDETSALFEDEGRTRIWLEILGALAEAQGSLGLIPADAAREIAARVREPVDLAAVASETRATGHSTLGLIRVLQRDLSGAREWVYYGATVQDVADTWTGLVAQRMLAIAERDLAAIDSALARLAARAPRHRDARAARTGSPGSRSRSASRPRCGWPSCAGTASAWRRHGRGSSWASSRARSALCRRGGRRDPSCSGCFLERLGLGVPEIPWTAARDRVAELVALLALITGTLAKVGNEIYNLQRPEIGEVAEARDGGRRRQHHDAAEAQPGALRAPRHARAGGALRRPTSRSKGWSASTSATARHGRPSGSCSHARAGRRRCRCGSGAELLDGLQVNAERMRANVDAQDGYVLAEPVMLALGEVVGPRRAHELVHAAAARGRAAGLSFRDALAADPEIPDLDLDALLQVESALGAARELVDQVLA